MRCPAPFSCHTSICSFALYQCDGHWNSFCHCTPASTVQQCCVCSAVRQSKLQLQHCSITIAGIFSVHIVHDLLHHLHMCLCVSCRLLQWPSLCLCQVSWSWVKMSSMMRWSLQQKLPALLLAHRTDKQNQVSKLLLLPSHVSSQSLR